MKVTNTKETSPDVYVFTITAQAAEFEAAIERTYLHMKDTYSLEGYPLGQAPREAIEEKEGKQYFYFNALNAMLSTQADELLAQAAAKAKVLPVSSPAFDLVQCNETGFCIDLTVAVLPQITLGAYKGQTFTYPPIALPEGAVEGQLQTMRQRVAAQAGEGTPLPELDDAFAQTHCGAKDLATLKVDLAAALAQHVLEEAKRQGLFLMLEKIGFDSTMTLPSFLKESELQKSLGNLMQHLSQHHIPLEQYLSQVGKTKEELEADYRIGATAALQGKLAAYAIAVQENIVISDVEVESEIVRLSGAYHKSVGDFKAETPTYLVRNEMLLYRTLRFLEENNTLEPEKAPEEKA